MTETTRQTRITSSHWGAFEVVTEGDRIVETRPFGPDPAPPGIPAILPAAVHHASRVARPSIRRAWLASRDRTGRGDGDYVTPPWDEALDIAAETADTPLNLEQITKLQDGKTGALIQWSAEAGARLAQADVTPLGTYAKALGLAFQIADDILDETGDEAKAGKRLQKDAEAGKATFVSLLGLDGARQRATDLVTQACDALSPYGKQAESLREAARFVISRES
jgi:hypothetical protein